MDAHDEPADRRRFPAEVARKLAYYVYRLIDPRNGETFYVGKGREDRVFAHVHAEFGLEGDDLDNKTKRIREIQADGFRVAHIIHRHGLSEETAFHVEAALIDAYPGLENAVNGAGSNEVGVAHAEQIIRRYSAEPAVFAHRALLISVNRSVSERPLYDATRSAWKINVAKAAQAEVILATRRGEIIGAFVARRWLPVTAENFPGREPVPGRFGFEGEEASEDIKRQYVGKRVPNALRKQGNANPIMYTWDTD